jgi:hypothetical protein
MSERKLIRLDAMRTLEGARARGARSPRHQRWMVDQVSGGAAPTPRPRPASTATRPSSGPRCRRCVARIVIAALLGAATGVWLGP